MMPSTRARGWCPSARRPMPTGDGLLVRLHLRGHAVPPGLARGLAQAARRFGNGLIDLTSRGNLQLRGISEATHGPLLARFTELGLFDEDPAADAIPNILSSPLAGIMHFGAHFDITPIITALETSLAAEPCLAALPAKFSLLVDDGGWPSLAGVGADLRFDAHLAPTGPVFRIGRDGTAKAAVPIGQCAPHELANVAMQMIREKCVPQTDDRKIEAAPDHLSPNNQKTTPALPIGIFRGAQDQGLLGLGVNFGRLGAESLSLLAEAAEDLDCASLRLTPWRALLLPIGNDQKLRSWRARLAAAGFILDAADPRLAVAACPGAPACARGTTPTQDDALRLAPLARQLARHGIGIHVSGCAKGCACAHKVPVTLVASDGRYGLVRNGKAQDPVLGGPFPIAAAEAMLADLVKAGTS
jgi:precorrin-3B synthase